MPDNGGFIQFRDPLEYSKGFYMKNYDDEMFGWKTIPAVTGDVLFFPGYLRHRTQPNKNTNEKRWVLTTNYISGYNEAKYGK
jgi:ectoine hydroxylase-related dioxygenase (phytanoyl-CoA dioxygenase family)